MIKYSVMKMLLYKIKHKPDKLIKCDIKVKYIRKVKKERTKYRKNGMANIKKDRKIIEKKRSMETM
jgi:hypothetical protein